MGFSALNMGPAIYYTAEEDAEPLPFKMNLALAFKQSFTFSEWVLNNLEAEYKISRFFVKMHLHKSPDPFYKAVVTSWQDNSAEENWRSIQHNIGYEITTLKYLHLRQGFLFDPRFSDAEMHWGIGISIPNRFTLDFHHIFHPNQHRTDTDNGQ